MSIRRALLHLVALVVLAGCTGSETRPAPSTTAPTTAPDPACSLLERQIAIAKERPADLIGLSKDGIDDALSFREERARDLAAVDDENAAALRSLALLVARGRPEVVSRWGETDGVDLHNRALENKVFQVIPQALIEAGRREDADAWAKASADASWAVFRLSARCHHLRQVSSRRLTSLPADRRPPVPILALDLATANRLVKVGTDGTAAGAGPKDLRLYFRSLSPDGKSIVARTGRGAGDGPAGEVVDLEGQVQLELDAASDCGGWLAGSTPVGGAYQGDDVKLTLAARPEMSLPLTAASCPVPGTNAGSVLVTRGRVERDDSWVAEVTVADGTTVRDIRLPACNVTSPAASPDGRTVALAAACDDPVERGIWTVSGSGKLTHILTCTCGVPTFSPDGQWLAFAMTPVEGTGGLDTRLGFAHPDGSGAFHLPEGQLSFPLWPAANG